MSISKKLFPNISEEQVDKIIFNMKKQGAEIRGNKLSMHVLTHTHGVVFRGQYDPFGKILIVEIIEKNWYVSYGAVWDKINKAIGKKKNILSSIASFIYGKKKNNNLFNK